MIHLDISPVSIVITCDDCPHWSACQLTRAEAETSGANHEERAHPDRYDFRHRIAKREHDERRRHAEPVLR